MKCFDDAKSCEGDPEVILWFIAQRARRRLDASSLKPQLDRVTNTKRKRFPTFLLITFVYAGNDLRSRSCVARGPRHTVAPD